MMNWVSMFIKKVLEFLYYSFYILLEGVFRTSKSWPTIISVVGMISIMIGLPTSQLVLAILTYELDIKMSELIEKLVMILVFLSIDKLLDMYYTPTHKK